MAVVSCKPLHKPLRLRPAAQELACGKHRSLQFPSAHRPPMVRSQAMNSVQPLDWDSVELRAGRLRKIKRSEARLVEGEDGMLTVAKCYCRTHDVVTQAEAEEQMRPAFVFPLEVLQVLEGLIGQELVGRAYFDTDGRRVKFLLDLREQAGFRTEEGIHQLESPWFDESVLND